MLHAPETSSSPSSRDSTIYVLSQLPLSMCEEILRAVTGSQNVMEDAYYPWHIKNRYYEAFVQFRFVDSPEHLINKICDGTPAVVLVVDNSKAIEEELLHRFNTESIDIPLVVGMSAHRGAVTLPTEDLKDACLAAGWEYIDPSQADVDEAGGQTGLSRLSEALQAHIWPHSTLLPRKIPSLIYDEVDPTKHDERLNSPILDICTPDQDSPFMAPDEEILTHPVTPDFDDNFAPFVSSTRLVSHIESTDPSSFPSISGETPSFLDFDNEPSEVDDPTLHLSSMFAALSGFRDQAMAMPEGERRKDFAAEIALRFARQLDAVMGDEESSHDSNRSSRSEG